MASLVKIVVLEKILNVVNSFSLFSIILLWKRMQHFNCKNLNLMQQRMLCAQFG